MRRLRLATRDPSRPTSSQGRADRRTVAPSGPGGPPCREVEEVAGAPDGLGWRTRASFAVDRSGRIGFYRHRSHGVQPVDRCPIVTAEVNRAVAGPADWRGVRQVEVIASPDGGPPVLSVLTPGDWRPGSPMPGVGLVVNGRTCRPPDRSQFTVHGRRFDVGPGVFWQVHPGAAALLTDCVMAELSPSGASGPPTSTPAPACSPSRWLMPSGPGAGWWPWSGTGTPMRTSLETPRSGPGRDDPCIRSTPAPCAQPERSRTSWCSTRPGGAPGRR